MGCDALRWAARKGMAATVKHGVRGWKLVVSGSSARPYTALKQAVGSVPT